MAVFQSGKNNTQQQERVEADAFINNLKLVDANGGEHNLGLTKVVLPLIAEENALHHRLHQVANENNGEYQITLTATVRVNSKKGQVVDPAQFASLTF